MAIIEIKRNPSKRELRQFAAILFPAFFGIVGCLVWCKTGSLLAPLIIWSVALTVSLVGYFVPPFMRVIFVGWMCAVYPIGWTISHVVLAGVFYLVLTPIGMAMRLSGLDPMQRRFRRSARTYWSPHNPAGPTSRYFRQF